MMGVVLLLGGVVVEVGVGVGLVGIDVLIVGGIGVGLVVMGVVMIGVFFVMDGCVDVCLLNWIV